MPIVQCPSCRDDVTAPESPPAKAIARCPLCQEEFDLADVMSAMPPALILVSGDEEAPMAIGPTEGMSGAAAAATSFDFSEKSAPAAKSKSGTTPRRTARPKRKQNSPIWEVVKVAGGGIIGLSLGQVILWWAFHRDPAELAPKVPAAMQWILPGALRSSGPAADTPSEEGGNVGSFSLGAADEMPFDVDGATPPKRANAPAANQPPLGGAPTNGAETAAAGVKRPPNNKNRRNRGITSAGSPTQPARPQIVRVSNSPSFGPDELETAIIGARTAFGDWRTANEEGDGVNAAAREFYTQFAKLGHTIAFADAASPQNRRLVQDATKLIKGLPEDARLMFGAASASWLRNRRSNEGVALYGDVTKIEKQGNLFETIVRLTDRGGRRVTVISGADPRSRFTTGDNVLVLGGIIEDPADRISGYEGLAPMVILGGLPIKFELSPEPAENADAGSAKPKPATGSSETPNTPKPDTPKPDAPKSGEPTQPPTESKAAVDAGDTSRPAPKNGADEPPKPSVDQPKPPGDEGRPMDSPA